VCFGIWDLREILDFVARLGGGIMILDLTAFDNLKTFEFNLTVKLKRWDDFPCNPLNPVEFAFTFIAYSSFLNSRTFKTLSHCEQQQIMKKFPL
jgi:hypothetical protein